MSNSFDDIRIAVEAAKTQINAAASAADSIASLLPGNLRKVGGYTLGKLKKELRDFNIHTGRWKQK